MFTTTTRTLLFILTIVFLSDLKSSAQGFIELTDGTRIDAVVRLKDKSFEKVIYTLPDGTSKEAGVEQLASFQIDSLNRFQTIKVINTDGIQKKVFGRILVDGDVRLYKVRFRNKTRYSVLYNGIHYFLLDNTNQNFNIGNDTYPSYHFILFSVLKNLTTEEKNQIEFNEESLVFSTYQNNIRGQKKVYISSDKHLKPTKTIRTKYSIVAGFANSKSDIKINNTYWESPHNDIFAGFQYEYDPFIESSKPYSFGLIAQAVYWKSSFTFSETNQLSDISLAAIQAGFKMNYQLFRSLNSYASIMLGFAYSTMQIGNQNYAANSFKNYQVELGLDYQPVKALPILIEFYLGRIDRELQFSTGNVTLDPTYWVQNPLGIRVSYTFDKQIDLNKSEKRLKRIP